MAASSAEEDRGSLLERAKKQEDVYDWSGAASSYAKILDLLVGQDLLQVGEMKEKRALALYKHAFQADNVEAFHTRLKECETEYSEAKESYTRWGQKGSGPRELRCEAMMAFSESWRGATHAEIAKAVFKAWSLAQEALRGFQDLGESREFGVTYAQLSLSALIAFVQADDHKTMEGLLTDGRDLGEAAIRSLLGSDDNRALAVSYMRTSACLKGLAFQYLPPLEGQEHDRKAYDYLRKAIDASEETAMIDIMAGYGTWPLPSAGQFDSKRTIDFIEKGLAHCKRSGDHLATAMALEWLLNRYMWILFEAEDQDQAQAFAKEAYANGLEAQRESSKLGVIWPNEGYQWSFSLDFGYYYQMADFETDPVKKRAFAEKALKYATQAQEMAERAGIHDAYAYVHSSLGEILVIMARTEKDVDKKREILERALEERKQGSLLMERYYPADESSRSADQIGIANVEAELAWTVGDATARQDSLRKSLDRGRKGLEILARQLSYPQNREQRFYLFLARYQNQHAIWLDRLRELSGERKDLESSADAFETLAEYYRLGGLPSRSAEGIWEAARRYDLLREHSRSSEKFAAASVLYRKAAESTPKLKEFFENHSVYMRAWSEIEQAKYHHSRQEHGQSSEEFARAAELLKSTRNWSYMCSNYLAWAKLDAAEHLSRMGKGQDAWEAFESAAQRFEETKKIMREDTSDVEAADERKMIEDLVSAADLRRDYCKARMVFEQAQILDRRGEESAASDKYGQSAEMLQRILDALGSDHDRREIQLIITLSRAWQMMAKAEAEARPELCESASKLFEEARELAAGDRSKSLCLGHSRFCKALEAGTRFADSGETTLHATATQHFEGAAKYYLKAGEHAAAEYANASKLLFDGYVYMGKASREEDQDKKAKLYAMAEKVFEASARSFDQGGYQGKREQVDKLLAKTRRDRELAISLTEVLRAPDLTSATSAFSSPTPTYERAIGLERFEHADVQATVIVKNTDLHVGDEVRLDIEMVNAGKGPAQLTKVENAIPRGFDVHSKPEDYRIEDSYINMKGKRLEPLKTEEISLVLKAKTQGVFAVRPRILYLDEVGNYRSKETESVEVKVKELGVSGWLRGPDKNR